ncbi:MAG: NFACT family protein [Nitrospirota bacterium]
MSLTSAELAAVLREIRPALIGGWIQKVFQPAPHTITLEIRSSGKTLLLLLSADPGTARLHLLSQRLPNPPFPPSFCQFLRAQIQGARIEAIEQVGGDRVVRLGLTAHAGPRALLAELTGKKSDLLLLDAQERVLATLNEGSEEAGALYHPPARPPHATGGADVAEPLPQPGRPSPFPLSLAIEERYGQREEELTRERLRQARLGELRKAVKKAVRRIEALRSDLDKAERYRDYARYGELLKANLGRIKKGQEQIAVVDYFDPALPELVIPLDPAKGPQGNMDDCFRKHRKHLSAQQEIRPRLEAAERELERVRAEMAALQREEWTPSPPESAPARQDRSRPIARHPSPVTRHPSRSGPFRRFASADGLPIYVGRNARENEELTFKFAHSDDLWLHAQGAPGSHVVVRLGKGDAPPPETLKDAATLALLYSDLKKSGKGEVIYTRRKWVRKAKGQPPGTVTVTQEKAVFVQLDRTRLDRLKEGLG